MATLPKLVLKPADWYSLAGGLEREWLLTNGLGGYASASLLGANTRRYHGLLVAAQPIPTGRTVFLSKLEEDVRLGGQVFALGVNEWDGGATSPHGEQYLDRVILNYSSIEFHYKLDKHTLIKTIWLEYGANITYVQYELHGLRLDQPAELRVRPFVTYKDYHSEAKGDENRPFQVTALPDNQGFSYRANAEAPTLYLQFIPGQQWEVEHLGQWYWNFYHPAEAERGLDSSEDLFVPHALRFSLQAGKSTGFAASLEPQKTIDFAASRQAALERWSDLVAMSPVAQNDLTNANLLAAADQFIVARPSVAAVLPPGAEGRTVIAGYHWFTDWGRDTMIALPGLTLNTGRYTEAANILRTFAAYLDEGMLPNRFPEKGETPEYNTVDATLWFFHAIYAYYQATQDRTLLAELFPKLEEVIDWHRRGTRYNIKLDESDGLLHAGAPGVQLTWMDAKIGDWVVTARSGKPVEINALWCNALAVMANFAEILGETDKKENYNSQYERSRAQFLQKFWYAEGGYLYDVIDADDPGEKVDEQRRDASLRPNQLFAISLPFAPLAQWRTNEKECATSVLAVCEKYLLTPYGLRTLAPNDARYRGRFTGPQSQRDAVYHNGTVWPWLIGSYVEAHWRVFGDKKAARALLQPLLDDLKRGGVGTINEVYDGDLPHRPLGCIAQAWSVAELLRLYQLTV